MPRILTRSHALKTRAINLLAHWIGGCVLCGSHRARADYSSRLCAVCDAQMLGRTQHRCAGCAAALTTNDHLCLSCQQKPHAFSASHAFASYKGLAAQLILRYKFHHDLSLAPLLTDITQHGLSRVTSKFDCIIPVPQFDALTHSRGFIPLAHILHSVNPHALVRQPQTPIILPNALMRLHHAQLQVGADKAARREQVKGAFAATIDLTGRRVLLVDDVYTSGATLNEAARICLSAGAQSVAVWVLARAGRI
jgi:ComF family protein